MSEKEVQRLLLLVEDDDDHAEIAGYYITENYRDINLMRFSDGDIAMKYLEKIGEDEDKKYPWLIFLDLKVPKYSGFEILSFLKSHRMLKRVPVVIFTTSSANKDITEAFDKGANSYISKPIEPEGFETTIRQIVDYWQTNQHMHLISSMNQ